MTDGVREIKEAVSGRRSLMRGEVDISALCAYRKSHLTVLPTNVVALVSSPIAVKGPSC